jgi:hypothetical protein
MQKESAVESHIYPLLCFLYIGWGGKQLAKGQNVLLDAASLDSAIEIESSSFGDGGPC